MDLSEQNGEGNGYESDEDIAVHWNANSAMVESNWHPCRTEQIPQRETETEPERETLPGKEPKKETEPEKETLPGRRPEREPETETEPEKDMEMEPERENLPEKETGKERVVQAEDPDMAPTTSSMTGIAEDKDGQDAPHRQSGRHRAPPDRLHYTQLGNPLVSIVQSVFQGLKSV